MTMPFNNWLQDRLTAHGFPVGEIDGIIGTQTVKALKAFESKHGLEPNGTADEFVVKILRDGPTSTIADVIDRNVAEKENPQKGGEVIIPRKTNWPRQSGVEQFYGKVGTNQTSLVLPYPMVLAWDRDATVRKITLHKKVAESAGRALERIGSIYGTTTQRRLLGFDLFGGSLNVRRMRGGTAWSMHSWGIAIDFDPERNQLKWGRDKARLAKPDCEKFWQCWEDEGWLSLGRARNFDWMHVQAALL